MDFGKGGLLGGKTFEKVCLPNFTPCGSIFFYKITLFLENVDDFCEKKLKLF